MEGILLVEFRTAGIQVGGILLERIQTCMCAGQRIPA